MRIARPMGGAVVAFCLFLSACPITLAASPTGVNTLWNFLGIPQGINKVRDATANKKGNRPNKERKPPLKRIADPANLESQNPAIKAAAKIKTEEDLAPQKIKAVKYLATIGCGCYPGVRESLLAALDDCTEEVRYQAAIAFCQAAGTPCKNCDRSGCCNAAVMSKLEEIAHGQDEKCCYKESSSRVRAAAENALNACRKRIPPAPVGEPPRKELPGEARNGRAGERAPVTLAGRVHVEELPLVPGEAVATAAVASADSGQCESDEGPCREGVGPGAQQPLPLTSEQGAQAPTDAGSGGDESSLPSNALAGNYGASSGPMSAAPNMIGDLFGGGGSTASIVRSFSFSGLEGTGFVTGGFFTMLPDRTLVAHNVEPPIGEGVYTIDNYNDAAGNLGGPPLASVPGGGTLVGGTTTTDFQTESYASAFRVRYDVWLPSPANGGIVGRTKIAENTSPIPRDRILCNYSYFDGVPMYPGGVNVSRFTPGFEKTFFNGWTSFELKIPMATTLDSTIVEGGAANTSHGEFGNMAMTFKSLLFRRESIVFSGGLMVALPTADDTMLVEADGTPLVAVRNRATHLGPFIGWLWTPNDRFFAQGFVQWDVGANGHPVSVSDSQGGLTYIGDINDTTFQYVDIGIGSWLYRDDGRHRRLTGLAWTSELHWNKSLQAADVVTDGTFRVGDYADNIDAFNLTVGLHMEFYDKTTVTAGYCCPLGGGSDREFNGEFRLMFNRRFGPQNRLVATPPI